MFMWRARRRLGVYVGGLGALRWGAGGERGRRRVEVDLRTGVVGKNGEEEVLVGEESQSEGVAGENQSKSLGFMFYKRVSE